MIQNLSRLSVALAGLVTLTNPALAAPSIYDAAVRDLWGKVKANTMCVQPGSPPLLVDNAGISPQNPLASESLRNLVLVKTDSAFDELFKDETSGVRHNFGARDQDTLRNHVNGDAFGDDPLVSRYRSQYLFITSDVRATSTGEQLLIMSAQGLSGCIARSQAIEFPADQIGEAVEPLDVVFLRTAREMVKRAKGNTAVYLSAEIAGEGVAPPRWTDTFVDFTRHSVQRAEEGGSSQNVALSGHRIRVQPPATAVTPEMERWQTDVKVERWKNSYRLWVSVVSQDGAEVVQRGLISTEELPPVPVEQLEQISTAEGSGTVVSVMDDKQSFAATFVHASDVHEYVMRFDRPYFVEYGVTSDTGRNDPKAALYDPRGKLVHEGNLPQSSKATTYRRKVDAGIYRLRLQNTGKAKAGYLLQLRGSPEALRVAIPFDGRPAQLFRDWYTGTMALPDGTRGCFARSDALRWSPEDWRALRPMIWFAVTEKPANARLDESEQQLEQRLDSALYYDVRRPIRASVFAERRNWQVPVRAREGQLQVLDGDDIMSFDALQGMTDGDLISLDGETADGRIAHVEYSLRGYQAAINDMLTRCNRKELRIALIRK